MARRKTEVFSMSFLDCITCGLGSVILLLVLSNVRSPAHRGIEGSSACTHPWSAGRARGYSWRERHLESRSASRQEQLSEDKARIARLYGDLSALRGKFASSIKDSEAANRIQGQQVAAREKLTDEMKRLYAGPEFKHQNGDIVGGVPIDSEYIVFIIDTSGSMFNHAWPMKNNGVFVGMHEAENRGPRFRMSALPGSSQAGAV